MLFATWPVAAHGSLREAVVAGGVLVLAPAVGAERGSGGDAPQLLPAIIPSPAASGPSDGCRGYGTTARWTSSAAPMSAHQ